VSHVGSRGRCRPGRVDALLSSPLYSAGQLLAKIDVHRLLADPALEFRHTPRRAFFRAFGSARRLGMPGQPTGGPHRCDKGEHAQERCRCPIFKRGKISYHAQFGVKLFHRHLVGCGICSIESVPSSVPTPALVAAFCDWFRTHRGVKEPTLRQYARDATDLLRTLGEDAGQWSAKDVRDFFLERASQCGMATTQALITSLRAFLRFLSFRGESRGDFALAIPAMAHWRLARLPRCLSTSEVNRLVAACDGTDPRRLRDRAIILMLARLGLRAGDVARLCLTDIDWNSGTLQVTGKGRYQVRLPLPQDVGDALLG